MVGKACTGEQVQTFGPAEVEVCAPVAAEASGCQNTSPERADAPRGPTCHSDRRVRCSQNVSRHQEGALWGNRSAAAGGSLQSLGPGEQPAPAWVLGLSPKRLPRAWPSGSACSSTSVQPQPWASRVVLGLFCPRAISRAALPFRFISRPFSTVTKPFRPGGRGPGPEMRIHHEALGVFLMPPGQCSDVHCGTLPGDVFRLPQVQRSRPAHTVAHGQTIRREPRGTPSCLHSGRSSQPAGQREGALTTPRHRSLTPPPSPPPSGEWTRRCTDSENKNSSA